MSVDRDKLALYVMGELDDAGVAEVERRVAEDPAWAAALAEEAKLELAMFEVAQAAPRTAPAKQAVAAPQPAWWRAWVMPMVGAMALAAAAMVMVQPPPAGPVSYSMEVRGGEAATRSGDANAAVPTYTKGSRLSLLLRPSSRTEAPQGVMVTIDGFPVEVLLSFQDGGGIELIGVFGENLPELSAGRHELQLVVPGQAALQHVFEWKDPAP
jgi:hypothetical protein